MKVTYKGEPGYHPGSGIDLVPGEMEVTDDQAAQLVELVKAEAPTKRKRGDTPQEDKE